MCYSRGTQLASCSIIKFVGNLYIGTGVHARRRGRATTVSLAWTPFRHRCKLCTYLLSDDFVDTTPFNAVIVAFATTLWLLAVACASALRCFSRCDIFFAVPLSRCPVRKLEPGNKEAVRAARRIKDKVAQAAKLNTPIRQVHFCFLVVFL